MVEDLQDRAERAERDLEWERDVKADAMHDANVYRIKTKAAEARVAAITSILNDLGEIRQPHAEWQFYIGQLYAALAGVPVAPKEKP